jgi:hypothetical protein
MNCTVRQKKTGIRLSGINGTGRFSNGSGNKPETSTFRIDNFSSMLENGQIAGNFRYTNFSRPEIASDIRTLIDLGNFRKFISIDTIENLEGKLNGNIHFQAGFKNSSFSRRNIENFQISGNAIIQDAELKLKNSGYLYNDINCQITLGYDFLIENLSLRIDDNDFFIKGRLTGAVPYLLQQNNTLNLKAELRSQNLDLTKYFEKDPGKVSASKYEASMLFPDDLFAELNVSASNFRLKKFNARNAIAHVNYKPGMYTLNSANFETMKGRVSGNGAVLLDYNKNLLKSGVYNSKRYFIPLCYQLDTLVTTKQVFKDARFSFGVAVNYNRLNYYYRFGQKNYEPDRVLKSHGNKVTYSLGVTYSVLKSSLFSLLFEKGAEFDKMTTDENKFTILYTLVPLPSWEGMDKSVSKEPDKIHIGFDHSFSEESQITTTLSYIGWKATGQNRKDQVEAAASFIYSMRHDLLTSLGLYYTDLNYNNNAFFAKDNLFRSLYITAGAIYSFSLFDVDLTVADSHLLAQECRKETLGRISVGFHL